MKQVLLSLFMLAVVSLSAQNKDEKAIRFMLEKQTEAWNAGEIESFMKGYWNSDSLMFIGKSGVKYGYKTTLDNYKKSYADTVAMGKLDFNLLQVKLISKDHAFVIGKWHLKRSIGDLQGHFTLLLRKQQGLWEIIADHSS